MHQHEHGTEHLRSPTRCWKASALYTTPDKIAASFAEDLVFEVKAMTASCPGSGAKAMADFMRDLHAMTELLAFDVEDAR